MPARRRFGGSREGQMAKTTLTISSKNYSSWSLRGWLLAKFSGLEFEEVCTIWRECLAESGGPFLFGERSMADAMYAPVVTRFMTYDVKLEPALAAYASTIMAMPEMQEWIEAAKAEPADIEELEVEY